MDSYLKTKYSADEHSAQTALDIFKGAWKSALPDELNLCTGEERAFFSDPRVFWAQTLLPGGFAGLDILELGPFEGYDSYLFLKLGAKRVSAVEANNINFLKCLILKDVLGFNLHLYHGDFLKFLQGKPIRYDIVWASGVLYHSERPIDLLNEIARHTDRVFIWTHVFEPRLLTNENATYFEPRKNLTQTIGQYSIDLHYRSYKFENMPDGLPLHYEGGTQSFSYWITRDDLERCLQVLGLSKIQVHSVGDLAGMPFVGLMAER